MGARYGATQAVLVELQTWAPGHSAQAGPQWSLSTQALPHRWRPIVASQVNAHAPSMHAAPVEPVGNPVVGHVAQVVPQASAVVFATQVGAEAVPRLQ